MSENRERVFDTDTDGAQRKVRVEREKVTIHELRGEQWVEVMSIGHEALNRLNAIARSQLRRLQREDEQRIEALRVRAEAVGASLASGQGGSMDIEGVRTADTYVDLNPEDGTPDALFAAIEAILVELEGGHAG
jgi:hypothetical protein